MSGMFESKQDKASRRNARTQQEEKAKRKSRIITISVISALVLFSTIAIVINSGFIRRSAPAVTIDGVNFTAAEFEYFFNTEYLEYTNFMSQFQGMGAMPEQGRPLSSQIYNRETGETWADFITTAALNRMASLTVLNNAARNANFRLTPEQRESIDDDMAMLEFQAAISGFPNTNSLLQQTFGTGMNERTYRKIVEFVALATSYSEHIRESFTFTSEELSEYYNENKDALDIIAYRQFMVYIEFPDVESFDTDEEYDEALVAAITETHDRASAIASGITDENSFIDAAYNYRDYYDDPESTFRLSQGSRLDIHTSEWLLDPARNYGDITIIDSDQGSYIVLFVNRDDNNYRTVGMRQILIMREQIFPEDFPLGEEDPDYIDALLESEQEARERAETVNSLFIEAGSTEEALIALIAEHSDDTTEGGYYSDISKFPYQSSHINTMKVVEEIENWLFDENREIGDSQLVFTSSFGYHILYFTGFGDIFFEMIATDRLRTQEHTDWLENLEVPLPVKRPAFILVHV